MKRILYIGIGTIATIATIGIGGKLFRDRFPFSRKRPEERPVTPQRLMKMATEVAVEEMQYDFIGVYRDGRCPLGAVADFSFAAS